MAAHNCCPCSVFLFRAKQAECVTQKAQNRAKLTSWQVRSPAVLISLGCSIRHCKDILPMWFIDVLAGDNIHSGTSTNHLAAVQSKAAEVSGAG